MNSGKQRRQSKSEMEYSQSELNIGENNIFAGLSIDNIRAEQSNLSFQIPNIKL